MKNAWVAEVPPVLYIVGAEPALIRRLSKERYGFSLIFRETPPHIWPLSSALLLFYPGQQDLISYLPAGRQFIACGDIGFMAEAFSRGAADFLSSPMHIGELKARLGRIFGVQHSLHIPGSDISIDKTTLHGPGGSCRLSHDEASLFRALLNNIGERVSRSALRDAIWPALPEKSRMVDMAVSRLRKCLKLVGGNSLAMQIETVQGFGYLVCTANGNEFAKFKKKL